MGIKKLRMDLLLAAVDSIFRGLDEGVKRRASLRYSMRDTLHCALAMFKMKSPSLLHFEAEAHHDVMVKRNLKRLYSIRKVRPHKITYYLERRDPQFDEKMAQVLWFYREVALVRERDI